MTIFGQLIIGPPGSGKTTYCGVMQQLLTSLGRNVFVINMDPANDNLTYKCDLNIYELITLDDVMDNLRLGPNGGLIYAIEYLEDNMNWLIERLDSLCKNITNPYLIFDFPGQIELYTHHKSLKNIIEHLSNKLDYRLCNVNLIDSHYCTDAGKFISVLVTCLNTMLHIEMPHINLLSKIDLIEQYGKLSFNIDYYTQVLDLNYILTELNDDKIFSKYIKLNKILCDIIDDFSLVSFLPLNIQNKECLLNILNSIDNANGYLYGHLDKDLVNYIRTADDGNSNNFMVNQFLSKNDNAEDEMQDDDEA